MTPPTTQPHTAPETQVSGAVPFEAEIRELWAANERARREYREHPIGRSCSRQHQCLARYIKRAEAEG